MYSTFISHYRFFITLFLSLILLFSSYCWRLGSDHLATNGDELVYAQIVRLTSLSGHFLPLKSANLRLRNTKPPLLFWQGMISTHWIKYWSLFRLRWIILIYTALTALLLFILTYHNFKNYWVSLNSVLIFCSFFSTYRYGRVFLTTAPESFFLFLSVVIFFFCSKSNYDRATQSSFLFIILGIIIGIALLYKSLALLIPILIFFSLWKISQDQWKWNKFFKHDIWNIILMATISLIVFSTWFFLDSERMNIINDFIFRENFGKFSTGDSSYLINFLFGNSSFWRILVSYPLNAGVLAPATIFLFWESFHRRKHLLKIEQFLWIWLITLACFFLLPNQRDERYLIPAMPALAILLAIRFNHIPSIVFSIILIISFAIICGMMGLATLLQLYIHQILYPFYILFIPVIGLLISCFGMIYKKWITYCVTPSILMIYICYSCFLIPFDSKNGIFDQKVIRDMSEKTVFVPSNFNGREESYRFLLPNSKVIPYSINEVPYLMHDYTIYTLPLDALQPSGIIVAKRLNLIDRANLLEMKNLSLQEFMKQLFHWEWLVKNYN